MDLSIVIPSYNEGAKIVRDIEAAGSFLAENKLAGEIIVVDDGSDDDTAVVAQETLVTGGIDKKVIRLEKNRGKGYAVRAGITATSGDYVMFADSGVCVPYKFALKGLGLLRSGSCETAHGSRKLPDSNIVHSHYVHRRVSSKLFRWLVVNFAGISSNITDSQCGFKMYRGDIGRELYGECQSERFMFDVEIILRANRKGYRTVEFPIEWKSDRDTRFRFFSASVRSMVDLILVKQIIKKEFSLSK